MGGVEKRCANIDSGSEPSGISTAEFLAALVTCEASHPTVPDRLQIFRWTVAQRTVVWTGQDVYVMLYVRSHEV